MNAVHPEDGPHTDHRVPFVVLGLDHALRVTTWNDNAARQFGHTPDHARGRDIAELVPVVGGEAAWRGLLVDVEDAAPRRLTAEDGRTWEWTPAPVVVAGAVVGVICYGADVTERAAAQRASALEHDVLRVLLDTLPVAVSAFDRDGTYIYADGLAITSLGLAAQMLGRNPLREAPDPASVEPIRLGMAGTASHLELDRRGRIWDSWHIPTPAGSQAALVGLSLDVTDDRRREHELQTKLELIEHQQQTIRALSTPIIEVWDGVIVLPLVGLVDSERTADIMDNLLRSVGRLRARFAILDMTGIDVVDTATANALIGMIHAVRLLGAEGILTGIHPTIAQTIVMLGVDLQAIRVHATLRQALKHCIAAGTSHRSR